MTPDEIRAVADAVKAGTCNDEQVALTLGWRRRAAAGKGRYLLPSWQRRDGLQVEFTPSFTSSIDACAAEIACRNWIWDKSWQVHPKRGLEVFMRVRGFGARGAALTDGAPSGDARALCAALLRAFAEYMEEDQDEAVALKDRQ